MGLYTGFDLHSSNTYVGIIDEHGKRIWKKKLRNDPNLIVAALSPFKEDIAGVVVESTFNWYWAVDLLMGQGYKVHVANPSRIQQYSGLKHSDNEHDAFWLAEMLRLNILPEGYIYPKEQRPLRADTLKFNPDRGTLKVSAGLKSAGIAIPKSYFGRKYLGRKRTWKREYVHIYLAVLIVVLLSGCSQEIKPEKKTTEIRETKVIEICRHSRFISSLSGSEAFDAALRENQEILSRSPKGPHHDEALFNIGLIYADVKNPKKDYNKSMNSFKRLIKEFPQSHLAGEAQVWIGVLADIEKSHKVDIEIEEQKRELK